MRSPLFALGLVVAAVSVMATEPTSQLILGTWKSNREATMASIPPKPNAKPGALERLAAIFGQMELTFTEHEITMAVPNGGPKGAKPHAYTYSITAEGGKRLVLKTVDKETGATDSMAILFDSDHRFSTPLDPRMGGREYFDRIGKR